MNILDIKFHDRLKDSIVQSFVEFINGMVETKKRVFKFWHNPSIFHKRVYFIFIYFVNATYDPQTYLYWGLTLAMEKNFEEAVEKYRISVELDPDSNNALGYWGAALEQLGEYDQAIEKMEKAMAINSFNELIYGVLVDSWYHKGEYQKAWEVVFRARNVQINIADKSLKRLAEAMPEPK